MTTKPEVSKAEDPRPGRFVGMPWLTPGVPDASDDGHDDYGMQHACDTSCNQN